MTDAPVRYAALFQWLFGSNGIVGIAAGKADGLEGRNVLILRRASNCMR